MLVYLLFMVPFLCVVVICLAGSFGLVVCVFVFVCDCVVCFVRFTVTALVIV